MTLAVDDLLESPDERSQELATVATIYPELVLLSPTSATIQLPVSPIVPVPVVFGDDNDNDFSLISHFPPLTLSFRLPSSYPDSSPLDVELCAAPAWLPGGVVSRLKSEVDSLWEEGGRGQMVFTAIDHVQSCAERAFDLPGPLRLERALRSRIRGYNAATAKAVFEGGTYECGICLEPKKGAHCHRVRSCTHVFCKQCLTDYYSSLIREGHVSSVTCSDSVCVKKAAAAAAAPPLAPPSPPGTPGAAPQQQKARKTMMPPTIPPDELRDIGVPEDLVKRYIDFKQKSALDADPGTVYCPRGWCQSPSRESIAALDKVMKDNHTSYYLPPYGSPTQSLPTTTAPPPPPPNAEAEAPIQKLQVCSRCTLAFCRVCHRSWHGDMTICRSPSAPLTAEELANEEYLKKNTTSCPECNTPVLKSHGCNHMICKCHAHFCFLCSAYLPPKEPYRHFNTAGTECYQRLWEGEEGDGEGDREEEEGEVLAVVVEEVAPAPAPAPPRPFVVGYVPAPVARQRERGGRRAQGRFADMGDTDDESDGEAVNFDDVPD